jgi:hypothetical protein
VQGGYEQKSQNAQNDTNLAFTLFRKPNRHVIILHSFNEKSFIPAFTIDQ